MSTTGEHPQLPAHLAHPPAIRRAAIVVVDGEHYPAAVADTIAALAAAGWQVQGAALLGGGEKLRSTPDYGIPHVSPADVGPGSGDEVALDVLALALRRWSPDAIIDLADEPVLVPELRWRVVGAAAAAGVRYLMPDAVVEPPGAEPVGVPSLAIVGTGKRIGKTAISATTARIADAHLGGHGDVVVVAMGRGGPAEPVVVDRAAGAITLERLLDISRSGMHAASDYLEDAALTGLTTVGCRRVGGGLLGVPAASNVPEGVRLAAALDPRLVVVEGSGSCTPPVMSEATLLVASTARPADLLEGLGPFRAGRADALMVVGNDPSEAAALALAAQHRLAVGRPDGAPVAPALAVRLEPHVVGNVAGRRTAAFTTAPREAATYVERALAGAGAADVELVSHALARRDELRRDLERALAAGVEVLAVEIKAAAIDVVAEVADRHGVPVAFLDNRPVAHEARHSVDELVVGLVDMAIARAGGGS